MTVELESDELLLPHAAKKAVESKATPTSAKRFLFSYFFSLKEIELLKQFLK
ncbi:hypothetical protein STRDD13_01480 [Streptococcus sp. DD13]|nr:hypothetical protein STRDD13_01480 [Streptococcus sp. DD13]